METFQTAITEAPLQGKIPTSDMALKQRHKPGGGGGGGHFRNFWVGMCRWDPGTLNLYQS